MSAAINAMHDDPAHRWTLQKRAERVGMPRSIFALKFKQTVATSPMKYAVRSLCNMTDSLAQIGSVLSGLTGTN
jgi:AraC-like DNA-binding protein